MSPTASLMRSSSPVDERAFHAWLVRHLPAARDRWLPLGDDVAAVPLGKGRVALLTTDALSEGTHFLRRSPPDAVGRAVAAASLSDIAAKGGTPSALLVDLLVAPGTPARWCEEVVGGAEAMARRFGAHVVGGDTKPGAGRSVVGTMLGFGRVGHLPARRNARVGDVVLVTGVVGEGGLAGAALRSGRPSVRALRRLLEIHPRVDEGQRLVDVANAMTDTSDGLAEGARLIASASGLRVVLREADLPWASALRRRPATERRAIGFYGGDYELLATVPARHVARALRSVAGTGTRLTVVGRVERGRGAVLEVDGAVRRPLEAPGWDPFRVRPP